jgi:hypothetical protein
MTDATTNAPKAGGIGKIVSGILAAGLTSYFMNWCSLKGVNFALFGVDSEIVKSTLIGSLAGVFVGLTPQHIVQEIVDAILFLRSSYRKICKAATTEDIPEEVQK